MHFASDCEHCWEILREVCLSSEGEGAKATSRGPVHPVLAACASRPRCKPEEAGINTGCLLTQKHFQDFLFVDSI